MEEEGHRLIDAPYGLHRIRFVAEMRVSPKHLERKIQLLEIDNRAVQTAAFRRVIPPEPLWLSPLLDQWPPFRLLATFQPQGSSVADSTDQVACWRIELLPLNRPPIERATLWFARDDGRLVQSRLLVRGRARLHLQLSKRILYEWGGDATCRCIASSPGCTPYADACTATPYSSPKICFIGTTTSKLLESPNRSWRTLAVCVR